METLVPKEESIRSRYAATLVAQITKLASSIATASLVPRSLGPAEFGAYSFLVNTAASLRGFLDPSAQQAFFTFSSQERRSGSLTRIYFFSLLLQIGLIFGVISIAVYTGLNELFWPGQSIDRVVLISVMDWAMFFFATLIQLGDSKGLSRRAQIVSLLSSLAAVIGLLILARLNLLNFNSFVGLNLITAMISGVVLGRYLLYEHGALTWVGDLFSRTRFYVRRWWNYASPLIVLEYYTPLVGLVGTYAIQRWYGSVEQGYMGIATSTSRVVLVFAGSATAIVWREIAASLAEKKMERAGEIFLRFNRLLFFMTLVLCVWLSVNSEFLISLIAGAMYENAVPVLMIMAFYPLAQVYGQLNAAALKASERTRFYRNWGIAFSVPDLLLTYFLLAPQYYVVPGLGLGAVGLALKLVFYSLISMQVYEYANLKFFGYKYQRVTLHKIFLVLFALLLAFITFVPLNARLIQYGLNELLARVVTTMIYFAVIGLVVIICPKIVGIEKTDVLSFFQQISLLFKRTANRSD